MGHKSDSCDALCDDWQAVEATNKSLHAMINELHVEVKRLQAYPKAVDAIKAYYPTDIFPDDGDSLGGKFGRSLCEQIHKKAAELTEEAPPADETG